MLSSRGGKRSGAGRPVGSKNQTHNRRKQRGLTAFDNEWLLIKEFERKLKKFGTDKAAEILKSFED